MAHVSHIADFEKRRRAPRHVIQTRDVVHLFQFAAERIDTYERNLDALPSFAIENYFSDYMANFHGLSDSVVQLFYQANKYQIGNLLLEEVKDIVKQGASQARVLKLCLEYTNTHAPELNETVRRMLNPALVNLVTQEQSNA